MPLCGALSPLRPRCAGSAHAAHVPMPGKTHDLAWLTKQPGVTEVVGVEFVKQALDEFAVEHKELPLKKQATRETSMCRCFPFSYTRLSDAGASRWVPTARCWRRRR